MHTPTLSNKSPFEALYGVVPVIHHLRTFGCACYPLLRPYNSTKLQAKTTKCVFLGYTSKYKRYICYAVSQNNFFVSRHVVFSEYEFPYTNLLAQTTYTSSCSNQFDGLLSLLVVTSQNVVTLPSQAINPQWSFSFQYFKSFYITPTFFHLL